MKTKTLTALTMTMIICLLALPVYGYNLREISNKDGLSNSAILSICQDNDGFMWFGSCDGLNMFDGSKIRVYKPSNQTNTLSGNFIHNIIETRNGTFWIATNYGLNKFDYQKNIVNHYKKFSGELLMDKSPENRLFVSDDKRTVYCFNEVINDFQKLEFPNWPSEQIVDFNIDSRNNLWIVSSSGVFSRYSMSEGAYGKLQLKHMESHSHGAKILYAFHEKDAVYYIDDTYTLFEFYEPDTKRYYRHSLANEIKRNGDVSSIIKYHDDYFIGFLTNGLIRLKQTPEKKDNYQQETIHIKSGIFCLYKDRNQDIIWIGTDCQGVFLYFDDPYLIRSTPLANFSSGIEKPVRSLLLDQERTLWIGTKGDGILKIRNYDFDKNIVAASAEHLTTNNSPLGDNSVYALAKSNRNIMWIGHDEGVDYYSYKERKIKKATITRGDDQIKYIHAIYEMNDSVLLLASVGKGIFKAHITESAKNITLERIEQIVLNDGNMPDNYFFSIFPENISSVLFGNRGNGLIRLNPNNMEYQTIQLGRDHASMLLNDVFSVTNDELGHIWCGTSLGLVRLAPDKTVTVFNESNGFPNNTIHGILKDAQNNIWLSTNQGVVKFNTQRQTFQTYNHFNGLKVTEFSDGAYFKDDKENLMFFGGINGFIAIKEANLIPKQYIPGIHINNLAILGESTNVYDYLTIENGKNRITLSHRQNFFSISFKTNDHIHGNNYDYYYKLDGVNDQWIHNGNSSTVPFTNLTPGNYKLLIKYKNLVTGHEGSPYELSIKVTPPWYTSPTAYLLYLLAVLLSIKPIVGHYANKHKKKRELMLERLNQKHKEEIYESKLRFFTNIAHEFCTPLTLIDGPCNMLLAHNKSDAYIRKYTLLIKQNADRLNELIQDLVEFRRIETGNRQPLIEQVQISQLTLHIADSFAEMAESKNITYSQHVANNLVWNTDRKFVTMILSNLISNAFKYVNKNGTVSVSLTQTHGAVAVAVSNTGKGIEQKDIDHVFDRYRILDNFENQDENNRTIRNGLGMAITHNLVQLLNGTIKVESTPGETTKFTVTLPRHALTVNTEHDHTSVLPPAEAQTEGTIRHSDHDDHIESAPVYEFLDSRQTILIIDDEPSILRFVGDIFAEKYNIIATLRASETDSILTKFHPDIILCDIMMPEIDGITLTKRIKDNFKTAHIPMILVSAKQKVEDKISGLSAGAEMYITKPFDVEFLKASVERLIHRNESLKSYFESPISAFDMANGKIEHIEDKKFVRDMHEIIHQNLSNKELSAGFIAAEMNLSTRHLYRKLDKIGAESPQKIITDSRLFVAKNLLISTKNTIDEIIYKSGFSNRSSFFKAFQERYDCTPKAYREKNFKEIIEPDAP